MNQPDQHSLVDHLHVHEGGKTVVAEYIHQLHIYPDGGRPSEKLDCFSTVPPLPPNFVALPEITSRIVENLLHPLSRPGVTLVLEGMGGVGKTSLVCSVCHNQQIRDAFTDGILWFAVGKEAAGFTNRVTREMAKALNLEFAEYTAATYRSLFQGRSVLVVLDDVWHLEDVEALLLDSPGSRLLITSRNREIAEAIGARSIDVSTLNSVCARDLLSSWANCTPKALPEPEATEILRECHGLALGLSMVGAALRDKPKSSWAQMLRKIQTAKVGKIGFRIANHGYKTLKASIDASIDQLSASDREAYHDLALLPEDFAATPRLLQQLWGGSLEDAEDQLDRFASLCLCGRNADGALTLHDLQLDFLRGEEDSAALTAKHSAFVRSLHVVATKPEQFASQVTARLLSQASETELAAFTQKLHANLPSPRLWPLWGGFEQIDDPTMRILQGHTDSVFAVALSSDMSLAVSGSFDQTVRIWDLQASKPTRILRGHTGSVNAVALSKDRSWIVSGSEDSTVRIWSSETGTLVRTFEGHDASVHSVAISPDQRFIFSGSQDGIIRIWDLSDLLPVRVLKGHFSSVRALAVSVDGALLVSASEDDTLRVWDLASFSTSRVLEAPGQIDRFVALALTPDGKHVVSGSLDGGVLLWDLIQTGPPVVIGEHTNFVYAVAVSADGTRVVSGSADNSVRVWRLDEVGPPQVFLGHNNDVRAVALGSDGKRLLSASDDETLRLWDLERPGTQDYDNNDQDCIYSVALSKAGDRAVAGMFDGTLRVWDSLRANAFRKIAGHSDSVSAIAISHSGALAVSGSDDHTVCVWNLDDGSLLHCFAGHTQAVSSVALSEDGLWAISGARDETARLWDLASGRQVLVLRGHSSDVKAVAFSADGMRAVTGSMDGTIRSWDLEQRSGSTLLTGAGCVSAIVLSKRGQFMAFGASDANTVGLLTLGRVNTLLTLTGHQSPVLSLAESPDGRYLASSSEDHSVRVWDVVSRACLSEFTCDTVPRSLSWSADLLLAGSDFGKIYCLRWELEE